MHNEFAKCEIKTSVFSGRKSRTGNYCVLIRVVYPLELRSRGPARPTSQSRLTQECYLNASCLAPQCLSSMNLDDARFLQALGFRIRELRLARGLTQEQLGERCELHRTFIGSVERGERNLSILNLRLIARVLRVPLAELLVESKNGVRTD